MVESAPSVPGVGGAGEVSVDVESLAVYLREVLIPLEERARKVWTDFGAIPILPELFGPVPHATELGGNHRWAHEVYGPTLEALANDVSLLITNLTQTIQAYQDQDDQVAEGLARMAAKLGGVDGFSSERVFAEERALHGGDPAKLAPPPTSTVGTTAPPAPMPVPAAEPAAAAAPAPPPPAETPEPSDINALK